MAKQLVYRVCGASWVVATHAVGVLLGLVMYPVISEPWAMVQSGPEQRVWQSLTDMSSMTWQIQWMHQASRQACCASWGQGGHTGGDWEVWEAGWMAVVDGGDGRSCLLSRQHVLMNAWALQWGQ
jgi:hypothetical protein